jgi:hypothetical protein
MSWQSPEGMEDYLKSTKLCDCENETLKGKANEIIKGVDTTKEAALKIFHFTREEILFGQDYPDVKASHTLEKGIGFCITNVTEVVPNRRIEFIPLSRFLRIYFPRNTFTIEPRGDACIFTASGCLRVGRLAKVFAKQKIEHGLSSVSKHMKEEGENLKRILEKDNSDNRLKEDI